MRRIGVALVVMAALVAQGCGDHGHDHDDHDHGHAEGKTCTKAVCVLRGTEGSEAVSGVVTFTQRPEGVLIEATISGLAPGKHGFHVHELGDINCVDGKCTGGHFNPDGSNHGGPDADERHVGDLGNVEADASGKATYSRTDSRVELHGPNSVVGRAIIVHAGADDLTSQPTGAAGARVAYGVIGIAAEK